MGKTVKRKKLAPLPKVASVASLGDEFKKKFLTAVETVGKSGRKAIAKSLKLTEDQVRTYMVEFRFHKKWVTRVKQEDGSLEFKLTKEGKAELKQLSK